MKNNLVYIFLTCAKEYSFQIWITYELLENSGGDKMITRDHWILSAFLYDSCIFILNFFIMFNYIMNS